MKSALYTLVAVAALTLGGVFTSTAMAGPPGHHHNHGHHGHNHGHQHYGHRNHYHGGWGHQHSHQHHGHYHNHSYYRPSYGYAQPNGIYLQGRNFGFGIGF